MWIGLKLISQLRLYLIMLHVYNIIYNILKEILGANRLSPATKFWSTSLGLIKHTLY